jgi:hypothetical protein
MDSFHIVVTNPDSKKICFVLGLTHLNRNQTSQLRMIYNNRVVDYAYPYNIPTQFYLLLAVVPSVAWDF